MGKIREYSPFGTYTEVDTTKLLHTEQTPYQKIEVFESEKNGRILCHDGVVMLFERFEETYHEAIAHTPLYIHPNPVSVLIIGGGDGGTAREVLKHDSVRKVVQVEIDERVIEVSKEFFQTISTAYSFINTEEKQFVSIVGDGIKYVADAVLRGEKYDVVIVDSTDPTGPAVGLFAPSFYENIYQVLTDDGIVVAQGESIYSYAKFQRDVLSNLRVIFPQVTMFKSSIPFYPPGTWNFFFAMKNTPSTQKRMPTVEADGSYSTKSKSHNVKDVFEWSDSWRLDKLSADVVNLKYRYINPEVMFASFMHCNLTKSILNGSYKE